MSTKKMTIQLTETNFTNGYQLGYIDFITSIQGRTLTDTELANMLQGIYENTAHSPTWKAGYVTGWMAALFTQSYQVSDTHLRLVKAERSAV